LSKHGIFKSPTKSAYNIELWTSTWERDYMKELEGDLDVVKWTKNHGIKIEYQDSDGKFRHYDPDFLVERKCGRIELVEVKAYHMIDAPDTQKKAEAATKWCKSRNMRYRLISRHQ